MEYRDYYATLGVPRTATKTEIKKAFRTLAREHHPDVNAADPKAEARFKEVNEAYDVLGDPEKRKLYDQLGADWESYQRAGAGGPGAGGPGASTPGGFPGGTGRNPFAGFPGGVRFEYQGDPADLAGFSDFFRTFFAGDMAGPTDGHPRRGRGAGQHGPGARPGRASHAGADAQAELEVSLEDAASGATARVQVGDRRLEVKVPAGIDTGGRIRLSGRAPGGGDLTLAVKVRPHPVFTRTGADVTRELPLTLAEALLGAEVPVGTLAGRTLLLTIPAGTQNGRQFRLRGHGLPRLKGEGQGDLLVRARIVLPTLDEEGRRLARALVDHARQPNPREGDPRHAENLLHRTGPATRKDGPP